MNARLEVTPNAGSHVLVPPLLAAAKAYRDLSTCYRLGRRPSEKLFRELEKASEVLKQHEEAP